MNRKYYKALLLLTLMLSLQASTCESNDENDEKDDKTVVTDNGMFSDPALAFKVTGAERVGRSLVVDFQVTNNTKQTLRNVGFSDGREYDIPNYFMWPTDDTGDYYSLSYMSFGEVMHEKSNVISSLGGTPVTGHIVVPMFDLDNKAQRVNVSKLVYCDNYKFEGLYDMGILRMHNISIADNRGDVWSPDRTLTFMAGQWKKTNDEFNDYVLSFTVTNNCSEPINKLTLSFGGGSQGDSYGLTDSSGKSFWGFVWRTEGGREEQIHRRELRLAEGDWNEGHLEFSIPANGSVRCEALVRDYDGSSRLTMTLGCQTDDRLLEDDYAYFVNTPI